MPRLPATVDRFDPYHTFRFRVKWDNQYVAGLTKMGALKRTTEVVEYREAGVNITSRKLPGKSTFDNVTLEKGITYDTASKTGRMRSMISPATALPTSASFVRTSWSMCSTRQVRRL